jgi:hypothetical protein
MRNVPPDVPAVRPIALPIAPPMPPPMLKPIPRLVLLDSVTEATAAHAGAVIVTGSHGGASVVRYARAVPAALYVFNDAGIGKDRAGIAALAALDLDGVAACAVSHDSARIGDARDAWLNGVVSAVNAAAARIGLVVGMAVGGAIRAQLSPLPVAGDEGVADRP